MDRIVLDTNVLVSVTITSDRPPDQIYQAWQNGELLICSSPALVNELRNVLDRPRIRKYQWMTEEQVDKLIALLSTTAVMGSGEKVVEVIEEDPDDDYVLSAAIETDADYIVSGDQHLLDLDSYRTTEIVTPSEYVSIKYGD